MQSQSQPQQRARRAQPASQPRRPRVTAHWPCDGAATHWRSQSARHGCSRAWARRGGGTTCAVPGDAASSSSGARQEALLFDFSDQEVPYEQAWAWQRRRVDALCGASPGDRRDSVLLLQHLPVYTLGAGSTVDNVGFDLDAPPHPIYRTERGGEVTYHGPGQLVMYPILDLARHKQDLHWYLRSLEEVVVRALASVSGLQGERVEGLTGVWVGGSKLAAIGVRAKKWVTYHGLALNVCTDLEPFGLIVPCGIADRPVGSVESALGLRPPVRAGGGGGGGAARARRPAGAGDWSGEQARLMVEYRYGLLEALEEVFGLELAAASEEEVRQLLAEGDAGGAEGGGGAGLAAAEVAASAP